MPSYLSFGLAIAGGAYLMVNSILMKIRRSAQQIIEQEKAKEAQKL